VEHQSQDVPLSENPQICLQLVAGALITAAISLGREAGPNRMEDVSKHQATQSQQLELKAQPQPRLTPAF